MSDRCPLGYLFSAVLDLILFILAGIDNIYESLDEFEIRPDPTTGFLGNSYGYDGNKKVSPLFLGFFHMFLFILAGNNYMHEN